MAKLYRRFLFLAVALTPSPAWGQHRLDFDREAVLARWHALSEKMASGRIEWGQDRFAADDEQPLKFSGKETVRQSFNRNGFAFAARVEDEGEIPFLYNALTIFNEKYRATLTKPKGKTDWVLTEWKMAGEDSNRHEHRVLVIPWLLCGNVVLPEWIADASFVIARIEKLSDPAGGDLVRVHFTVDASKRKSAEAPEHIKSGFIDFDPGHVYCPRAYEYHTHSQNGQGTERGQFEYDLVGATPVLKSQSVDTALQHKKYGLVRSSGKCSYQIDYQAQVPDEEFRLSFYGLPEPVGVVWPTPVRWWLWLTLAAAGALALAFLFRHLKLRHLPSRSVKQ